MAGDFDHGILREVGHRPWPVPGRPWVMTQTWNDLLFAHWRADPVHLRSKVPAEFELDLFDGAAWIGVVPFRMSNVALRGVPSISWLSAFPELNVRTYVRVGDRPGVYFFSLDAGSALAVLGARTWLNLPYYSATMHVTRPGDAIHYESRRAGAAAELVATYQPIGPAAPPVAGTLEYFLTERYCLYHLNHRGRPYRLEIHHPPWALQPAAAQITRNTMAAPAGLMLQAGPPLLHFSARQDVVAWRPSGIRP